MHRQSVGGTIKDGHGDLRLSVSNAIANAIDGRAMFPDGERPLLCHKSLARRQAPICPDVGQPALGQVADVERTGQANLRDASCGEAPARYHVVARTYFPLVAKGLHKSAFETVCHVENAVLLMRRIEAVDSVLAKIQSIIAALV